jgi:hypothetical protein
MKRLEYPVCPCCECEVNPTRAGLGRFLCPFCDCECRHSFLHWFVGLTLLGGAGFGMWKLLGKALSAGFTLPWQAQLLGTVIGASSDTAGHRPDPRYKVVKPGSPPQPSSRFQTASIRPPGSPRPRKRSIQDRLKPASEGEACAPSHEISSILTPD